MQKSRMFIKVLRLLLSLILIVFGINGFIGFLPMPEPPEAAAQFLQGLSRGIFVFPVLYGLEVLIGLLLLVNRYVVLGLLAFFPLAVSILLYHLFLDPAGGAAGYLTFIIEILLLIGYRDHYRQLFESRPS